MSKKTYLVTGAAGFVGSFLSARLLEAGHRVVGVDSVNDYYDPALKEARLDWVREKGSGFRFVRGDFADAAVVEAAFEGEEVACVAHMGAQAGVRYSLKNPQAYMESNFRGFLNVLEACRQRKVEHLVFASSSSVYGGNKVMPFSVGHRVDHPVSLYAASKKSNEMMAHSYAHLYGVPCTGLRFFTVYGPWGRPDMAYFSFTKAIVEGKPIRVFNEGRMQRDFTYIDDIVEGVLRVCAKPPVPNPDWDAMNSDPGSSWAPYRIFNIGNHQPVELMRFIEILEEHLGRKAEKEFLPMQPGDVEATYADISDLEAWVGFRPETPLEKGLGEFVAWYRDYYGVSVS